MNVLGHLVMFCWVPAVLAAFSMIQDKRRAAICCFMIGWLFLPFAGYSVTGLPEYDKVMATAFGVLLGIVIYDSGRLFRLRPRWYDLPMLIWCLCPLASSLSNGLGTYDGCTAIFSRLMLWGVPYLAGRVYFADREGLLELGVGILVGALVYIPFALVESRLSAQIHKWVYGIPTRASWEQMPIFGPLRWKPSVFLDSALAYTMFMVAAARLVGVGLWQIGRVKRFAGTDMAYVAFAVLFGAILGKTMGALTFLLVGIGSLFTIKLIRVPIPLICLLVIAPTYMTVRATGLWSGDDLVALIHENISENRAGSLEYRMYHEDLLLPKALERPVFGWGGWGRSLVYNERGVNISVTDGLWVIAIGQNGLVGLISLYAFLLLPAAIHLVRQPARFWTDPTCATPVAFSVVLTLFAIDCLLNAMPNPLFTVAAGGLVALPRIPNRIAVPRVAPSQYAPARSRPVPVPPAGAPAGAVAGPARPTGRSRRWPT